ncbi:AraC family transcriptional regulator [Paenibacillus sp. sgz302251]|uniref:AraC family transcriptional regulator n=1 Tax=Paenibacillus sp. sgz302251 TaxID=3414493 RepID=UPI003C7D06B1
MDEASTLCVGYTSIPTILIVGDVTMKAGTIYGPRALQEYELIYYPNGSKTEYKVENQTITLAEPCFLLSRPGETHIYEYDPVHPSRHLFIHFTFEGKDGSIHNQDMRILQSDGPSYIPVKNELLIGMMKQIMYIAYTHCDRLQVRGSALLLALLQELNGIVNDMPQTAVDNALPIQIANALEYIERNLLTSISIEAIAQHVGWTHEHFSRLFAQYMGQTPREAIVVRRVERACQLLMKKDWSVKQIAHAVGYTDENYFYRVFKAIKGMTAMKYREKYYDSRFDILDQGTSLTPYPPNSILFYRAHP